MLLSHFTVYIMYMRSYSKIVKCQKTRTVIATFAGAILLAAVLTSTLGGTNHVGMRKF